MAAPANDDLQSMIKCLAEAIKDNVPMGKARHDMMNMLTGIGSSIYLMESRISELEDIIQEWTYEKYAR